MFNNVGKQKQVLLDELRILDANAKERSLSDAEKVRKDVIYGDLERITLMEEARDRSRGLFY